MQLVVSQLWYGVVSMPSKGIAAQNAFQRKPCSLKRTVFYDGLFGILRACGRIAASSRRERRYALLVELYQQ